MIQLIYASSAAQPFNESDLSELLAKSRTNNQLKNVSGMLLHRDGSLLQILEGEPEDVLPLFKWIENDKRHTNFRLLLRSEEEQRSVGDW